MTMFRSPRNSSMACLSPQAGQTASLPCWLTLAAVLIFSATSGGAQQQPSAPAPTPADNKPATYVGSETCQACHEDIFNAFQKNPHHVVETDKKRGFDTK